jgi:nitroimidazol reductase NimA-like FMN-containing flavoprotein (pyridoxamine 5'-phosphate oxidase superfamily)
MSDDQARLDPLTHEECLELLRSGDVGRIAFDVDEFPVILPVNYRLVETSGRVWIALRTRPGNVIARAPSHVAFQVDEIDPARRQGWSVLARGTLHAVDPGAAGFRERFDPHPWIEAERRSWLIIEPFALTGRRLHGAAPEWAFVDNAYL